jgi:hypothetical protein
VVVCIRPGTALPAELPERGRSGRDSNPRPVDSESITGNRPAHSRRFVAVVMCDRDAESNRNGAPKEQPLSPDNRAAPARDDRSARIRTRTSEVGARRASGYTTDL